MSSSSGTYLPIHVIGRFSLVLVPPEGCYRRSRDAALVGSRFIRTARYHIVYDNSVPMSYRELKSFLVNTFERNYAFIKVGHVKGFEAQSAIRFGADESYTRMVSFLQLVDVKFEVYLTSRHYGDHVDVTG